MMSSTGVRKFATCVHNGTRYPPRPAALIVEYIGPDQPTTWIGSDSWTDPT